NIARTLTDPVSPDERSSGHVRDPAKMRPSDPRVCGKSECVRIARTAVALTPDQAMGSCGGRNPEHNRSARSILPSRRLQKRWCLTTKGPPSSTPAKRYEM